MRWGGMQDMWERLEMHLNLWPGNSKGRDHLEREDNFKWVK
jgi:hypothetical protein